MFLYNFIGDDEKQIYISDKEGIIKKIYKKDKYLRNDILFKLEPQESPNKEIEKRSACNTHPHNFYFQLLAETGFIGFIYVY